MKTANFLTLAVGVASLFVVAAPVFAQDRDYQDENNARLQRIEKDLREVRSIVLQARSTGQPVEIRTAASDDQITTLQTRLDDIEQTVRGLTGQMETISHQLDLAKQDDAAGQTQTAALADRLDKVEKQLAAMTAPPPPPPQGPGGTLNGQAGSGQAGPGAADASPAAANDAYTNARQLMLNGDYASAADAFQRFIDTYGSSGSVPAAHYWLGQIKYSEHDYQAAAANLVGAIKTWPKTSWAPDAMLMLGSSLVELNKPTDACAAMTELDRRYPRVKLSPGLTAREAAIRAKASCSR
jgi:tol-pal system protein YbgF